MAYRLGVDLGTTFTAAVLLREHTAPEVFPLGARGAAVPSALFVGADGSVAFAEDAEDLGRAEPGRLVREFKRRLGDPAPLLIGSDGDGRAAYHAHDVAAAMIAWVVAKVVEYAQEAPDAVAVTHPASWEPDRIELLHSALTARGLRNLTLLSEPEAVAYTYAYAGRLRRGDTVAVYGLGAHTFEVAMLRANEAGRFVVVDRPLGKEIGGVDLDDAVFAHVLAALPPEMLAGLGFDEGSEEPIVAAASAIAELRASCTAAKEILSTQEAASVQVVVEGRDARVPLTRAHFETMILSALLPTLSVIDQCAKSAALATPEPRKVLLAGGSTRIPLITELLAAHLGDEVEILSDIDPKMVVAAGAVLAIASLEPEARAETVGAGPAEETSHTRAESRGEERRTRARSGPRQS